MKLDSWRHKVPPPDIGWVDAPGLRDTRNPVDWVTVFEEGEGWAVLVRRGSPYEGSSAVLPRKNGIILALPAVRARDVGVPQQT